MATDCTFRALRIIVTRLTITTNVNATIVKISQCFPGVNIVIAKSRRGFSLRGDNNGAPLRATYAHKSIIKIRRFCEGYRHLYRGSRDPIARRTYGTRANLRTALKSCRHRCPNRKLLSRRTHARCLCARRMFISLPSSGGHPSFVLSVTVGLGNVNDVKPVRRSTNKTNRSRVYLYIRICAALSRV